MLFEGDRQEEMRRSTAALAYPYMRENKVITFIARLLTLNKLNFRGVSYDQCSICAFPEENQTC